MNQIPNRPGCAVERQPVDHLILRLVLSDMGDFTISVWVDWNASSAYERVFDLGTSDIA